MTKKQYFLFLWLLSSLSSIFFVVYSVVEFGGINHLFFFQNVTQMLLAIAIRGVIVFFGFYCAQEIGARLLLLDENYHFMTDIFKPAVIVGFVYVGIGLIINALIPIDTWPVISSFDLSYYRLSSFFNAMWSDLAYLLVYVSGVAFIIKKLAKDNVSTSTMMMLSIGLVCISSILVKYTLYRGSFNIANNLVVLALNVVLGGLFWKKGLEAAMLFHLIFVALIYWIVPFAMSVVVA